MAKDIIEIRYKHYLNRQIETINKVLQERRAIRKIFTPYPYYSESKNEIKNALLSQRELLENTPRIKKEANSSLQQFAAALGRKGGGFLSPPPDLRSRNP